MKQVFNNRMVDVFGTVLDIRKDRCCMVQTEAKIPFESKLKNHDKKLMKIDFLFDDSVVWIELRNGKIISI